MGRPATDLQGPAESRWPVHFDLRGVPPDIPRAADRWWLHLILLLATLLTTTAVGARMQFNFNHNLPAFAADHDIDAFWSWWSAPGVLRSGLPFSLTLLAILLAHESGHYVACLYYGVSATLPFFLPAPTFTGTLGAFIRIRSPIYSRKQLFDIGIAGPIAGFALVLPTLAVGLALSKAIPGIASIGTLRFGTPAALWLLEKAIFPAYTPNDIYLHPVARAAWIGLFATALNLLPAGQLDGGHIVYALFGNRHKWITRAVTVALLPLGFLWYGWLLWALLLFFFARRHPAIYDLSGIGTARRRLAWLSLAMLLLSFTASPVNQ